MYFSLVTITSLALALASRRPLGWLLDARFRFIWVLWLAIAIRLLFVPGALYPLLSRTPFGGLPRVGGMLYILSLAMVVLFTWLNRRILGIAVIGLGLLLNALVIGANGGQMPVDPAQAVASGQADELAAPGMRGEWSTFTLAKPETRLSLLGDRISVPMPFKEPSILSLGDLVISAGILLFFLLPPRGAVPQGQPTPRVQGE
jgi:hypothetical protein